MGMGNPKTGELPALNLMEKPHLVPVEQPHTVPMKELHGSNEVARDSPTILLIL